MRLRLWPAFLYLPSSVYTTVYTTAPFLDCRCDPEWNAFRRKLVEDGAWWTFDEDAYWWAHRLMETMEPYFLVFQNTKHFFHTCTVWTQRLKSGYRCDDEPTQFNFSRDAADQVELSGHI